MEITTCCSDGLLHAVQGLLNVQNQKGAGKFVFNSAKTELVVCLIRRCLIPDSSSAAEGLPVQLQ